MSLRVQENPHILQEVQETCLQRCCVAVKQLAEKVYDYITQFLKVFYVLGYIAYRAGWEGKEIGEFPTGEANYTHFFRRILQDPIEEVISVQGADPRLDLNHFHAPIGEDLIVPEAPEIDTAVLNRLFEEQININDPQSPHYVELSTINDDPDAPATYLQLKEGLQRFLQYVTEHPNYSPELPKMLKHICFELQSGHHPLDTNRECLLGLARAGHRHCPTLMNGCTRVWYGILKTQARERSFPETILSVLHDLRDNTLYRMAEQDVHYYQEYLACIGTYLGIKFAETADNDDPYLMIQLAPRYSLPAFFQKYTPEVVIQEVARALNGTPRSADRPWERIGRKIPFELTVSWLQENLPAGRAIDDYLDAQTGALTHEATLFILKRLQIFTPELNSEIVSEPPGLTT